MADQSNKKNHVGGLRAGNLESPLIDSCAAKRSMSQTPPHLYIDVQVRTHTTTYTYTHTQISK